MTRRAARITHDEVRRAVRAIQSCGLAIGRVIVTGDQIEVVIGGDSGEDAPPPSSQPETPAPLLREPKL